MVTKYNPDMTQAAKVHKKVLDEFFTPEEQKRLKGLSHWECHHPGRAKIIAPLGKAFAEAMVKLQTNQPQKKQ